jgi:hypothetical protein
MKKPPDRTEPKQGLFLIDTSYSLPSLSLLSIYRWFWFDSLAMFES